MHGVGTVYYWGNTPATDVINLPLNEGCCYSRPLSVLACGVGDPRNVLLSLCNLPETYEGGADLRFKRYLCLYARQDCPYTLYSI